MRYSSSHTSKLIPILGVAIAYYLVGRLALLLAIPPGYATSVWPSAGVALLGTLAFGYKAAAGVWLGSFLLNIFTSLGAESTDLLTSLIIGSSIALGAALQSVISTHLIRRSVGFPNGMETTREIILTLGLAGPVGCTVNALWGPLSLLTAGLIQWEELPYNIATWWAGDIMGVTVLSPLLVFLPGMKSRRNLDRSLSVSLPLIATCALTIALFIFVRERDNQRVRDGFLHDAQSLVRNLEAELEDYKEVLSSIAHLFLSSDNVSRSEFRTFVLPSLERHNGIFALAWDPVISREKRQSFEQKMRSDGFENFEIYHFDASGIKVRDPERDEYVVIEYIEPQHRNGSVIGFNPAATPERGEAIEKARRTGEVTATRRIDLLQGNPGQGTFVSYYPVMRGQEVLGYVGAVFALQHIIESVLDHTGPRGLDFKILDVTYDTSSQLFSTEDMGRPEPALFQSDMEIEFGGRRWLLRAHVGPSYLARHRSYEAWSVLAGGLLFTGAFGVFLLILTGTSSQLRTINHKLLEEVGAREESNRALLESEEHLVLLNRDLEERVLSRTKELAEANEILEERNNLLTQATRFKSQFLANMSHEIRTPLTSVIGLSESALAGELSEEEVKQGLSTILRNSNHLLGVINDILDLSKIEAGKLDTELLPVPLFELLADVEKIVAPLAKEKNIGFKTTFHYPLPRVITTDPTRFKQILINLCGNAVKFTSEGEVSLLISCSREAKLLSVTVKDTGIGLSEDQKRQLFTSFSQGDTSTTRRFGGTGLGLVIAHELAAKLGGEIQVESAPGKGSCFTAMIATGELSDDLMTDRAVTTSRGTAPVHSVPILENGRVLLVEDGQDNQAYISFLLRRMGVKYEIVENGALAIEAVRREPFDLILMDMQMPVMDGYTATRRLRELGYTIPIVALTANIMKEDVKKCLEAGCDDYVGKPFQRQAFFEKVRSYIISAPAVVLQ